MADGVAVKPVFIALTLVSLAVTVVSTFGNRRVGRRAFWAATCIASVFAFFIAYPPDWKSATLLSLLVVGVMVFTAYTNTPFIKIGGKIYAFYSDDRRPDSSAGDALLARGPYGGGITASKSWWRIVFIIGICDVGVITAGEHSLRWLIPAVALVVVLIASACGYRDGNHSYPIAQRQNLQFGIVSVLTLAAFTVFYFGGYFAARRLRTKS